MTDSLSQVIEGYEDFLRDLKERIRGAQVRAALAVNRELVSLYWNVGREILTRQQQLGWGAKVIDRLASDRRQAFPEFAGKMNFYLSAVDDLLRHDDDQPTIGIILCKTKNGVIVEHALRDTAKPMGVSTYQLTESLPKKLEGSLPTVEELEAELSVEQGTGEDNT